MADMMEVAIEAARKAGRLLTEGMSLPLAVERQVAHDVKLDADRKAEEVILEVIRGAFPEHAVLSEECGRVGVGAGCEWVIDPLDGTYNYFRRVPLWVTSIALRSDGEELLGVVFDPCRDELFTAERGKGAFLNGRPIRSSAADTLERSVVGVAYSPKEEFVRMNAEAVLRLAGKVDKVRSLGSAALEIAYVACGRFDAFFEYGIWPWDVAAGTVLVREAGGLVTVHPRRSGRLDILATNGKLHEELGHLAGFAGR